MNKYVCWNWNPGGGREVVKQEEVDGIKEGCKTRGQRRWKELRKVVKQEATL